MNIVCLDLELNQPSNKIIQIGYTLGNPKTGRIIRAAKIYVNPNEPLNPEIINLTGIREDHMTNALTLEQAYKYMLNDLSNFKVSKIGLAWGDGDYRTLKQQLNLTDDEFYFRRNFINVKSMYQAYAIVTGKTMFGGLGKAAKEVCGGFKGMQHDALDDAENTWLVFRELTKRFIIAERIVTIINE